MKRPAYLAGQWYPDTDLACQKAMDAHAAAACPQVGSWRGLVAPHAGWFYSGDAMGHGYRWLGEANPDADLVVLFGSHLGAYDNSTIFCDEAWETPVGALRTAIPLAHKLVNSLALTREPASPAHTDNAAEVHMPWIRRFFGGAELLMLGVAANETALSLGKLVAEVCLDAGRHAVFIGSTDLTHYGPSYGFEPRGVGESAAGWVRDVNDQGFLDCLVEGDASAALVHARENKSACCPGAAAAALCASRVGRSDTRQASLVDHYLSSDVMAGPSFVGYGAVVVQ